MASEAEVTQREIETMQHALGWPKNYRNHYCASEGHHSWPELTTLIEKGLMRVARKPSQLSGGDTVFAVTDAGIASLRALEQKAGKDGE